MRRALPMPDDGDPVSATKAAAAAEAASGGSDEVTGTIRGYWGFDQFTGPTLKLQDVPGKGWTLASDSVLIAGRENHLTLSSTGTACINNIALQTSAGTYAETQWKPANKPNTVDVSVSLKSLDPGAMHLAIRQYGEAQPVTVSARTFSEPAKLDGLVLHAGDTTAMLTGTSLDQVKQLAFGGLIFAPVAAPYPNTSGSGSSSELRLSLPPDSPTPKFHEGEKLTARFTLNDGRTLTLPVTVAEPRPSVVLLSKKIQAADDSPIHLADPDDLPINQQLTFSLKSSDVFPRDGEIEIANADHSLHTMLSVAAGTLVLQNPHTLLGTLDPLKSFGTSAFGPLRLRAVAPDGTSGDWLPLVTLVRLPDLKDVHCTAVPTAPCTLDGDKLYLIDSIATDPAFTATTTVPDGFIGTTLTLQKPAKTGFYLRLRDDPAAANTVTLPVIVPREKPVQRAKHAETKQDDTAGVGSTEQAPETGEPAQTAQPAPATTHPAKASTATPVATQPATHAAPCGGSACSSVK